MHDDIPVADRGHVHLNLAYLMDDEGYLIPLDLHARAMAEGWMPEQEEETE